MRNDLSMNEMNNLSGIAGLGRGEDSMLAHVAPGEMVVPPVISPQTQRIIEQEMMSAGLDPNEYTVGQGMSINPITGMAEFGFLKKLGKKLKKVANKIAPVAAVIPGPWQAPAIMYNKGKAVVNIAKGEGGLGDIMTIMAGGSQKVFGKEGALQSIKSGDFLKAGGGFKDALRNIGKVDGAFKPLQYARNIGQTYMDDQKKGYFGLFNRGEQLPEGMTQEQYDALSDEQKAGYATQRNLGPLGTPVGPFLRDTFLGTKEDPGFLRNLVGGGGEGGGLGGNAGLMAMAALYGKATKDAAERTKGGLQDIRTSIRPDLMPAPTFTGFDLGIRAAAKGGLMENELDLRMGGPSIGPGTGTSDDIPAMLSDGEFVMTSAANNGLGGFKVTKTETGIELIPNGKPDRQKGAKNMDKLMKTFEQFNKVGQA